MRVGVDEAGNERVGGHVKDGSIGCRRGADALACDGDVSIRCDLAGADIDEFPGADDLGLFGGGLWLGECGRGGQEGAEDGGAAD